MSAAYDYMRLVGGGKFFPGAPRESRFGIESIAAGLAKECRYGGQMDGFYSVAEHSVLVAQILPPELRLQGLLHDASEAWLRDQTRPVKQLLPDYRAMEDDVQGHILQSFGLPAELHPLVKWADDAVWMAEEIQIFGKETDLFDGPAGVVIECLEWRDAQDLFLDYFNFLTKKA